jgi:hypothetical protein
LKSLVILPTPGFGRAGARLRGRREARHARGIRETINARRRRSRSQTDRVGLDEICKNDLAFLTHFIGYWTDTDFMDEITR